MILFAIGYGFETQSKFQSVCNTIFRDVIQRYKTCKEVVFKVVNTNENFFYEFNLLIQKYSISEQKKQFILTFTWDSIKFVFKIEV
jgi:hypothetical protein